MAVTKFDILKLPYSSTNHSRCCSFKGKINCHQLTPKQGSTCMVKVIRYAFLLIPELVVTENKGAVNKPNNRSQDPFDPSLLRQPYHYPPNPFSLELAIT
jgi:hypothetical protein